MLLLITGLVLPSGTNHVLLSIIITFPLGGDSITAFNALQLLMLVFFYFYLPITTQLQPILLKATEILKCYP